MDDLQQGGKSGGGRQEDQLGLNKGGVPEMATEPGKWLDGRSVRRHGRMLRLLVTPTFVLPHQGGGDYFNNKPQPLVEELYFLKELLRHDARSCPDAFML